MRRSSQVAAPLLASTALAILSGCKQADPEFCVDDQNAVVTHEHCRDPNANRTDSSSTNLHYLFGGHTDSSGTYVTDASPTPLSGRTYHLVNDPASQTERGGFGEWFIAAAVLGVAFAVGRGE